MHALTVMAHGVPAVVAGAGAVPAAPGAGWAEADPRLNATVATATVLAAANRATQRRVRVGTVRWSSAVTTHQLLASGTVGITDRLPERAGAHARRFSPNRSDRIVAHSVIDTSQRGR
jgi:hypothetical protein